MKQTDLQSCTLNKFGVVTLANKHSNTYAYSDCTSKSHMLNSK